MIPVTGPIYDGGSLPPFIVQAFNPLASIVILYLLVKYLK